MSCEELHHHSAYQLGAKGKQTTHHGYPVRNVVESADRQEFEKMLYEYLRNGGDTLLVEEALSWYDRYIIQRQSGLQSLLLRQKDLADRERFYEMRMLSRRINMIKQL